MFCRRGVRGGRCFGGCLEEVGVLGGVLGGFFWNKYVKF